MVASVVLLGWAMKTLPVGTAYAVWTGIGAVGTAWGLALSVPLCLVLDHFRLLKLPAAAYDFITYMPFRLKVLDVVLVAIFPLVVSWLAARYPAKKAAALNPVDALRAE